MTALVIGGGVIGLSSAYYLNQEGWDVTVIDKTDLSDNCSYGNLGMIVPSHFVPLAAPGMIAQGIKWMFDSHSPFYVKPRLNMDLMKWASIVLKRILIPAIPHQERYYRSSTLLKKPISKKIFSLTESFWIARFILC